VVPTVTVQVSKNYAEREATSKGRGKTVVSENYYQFRLSFLIPKSRGFHFATAPILVVFERVMKLDTGVSDENLSRKFQIWLKSVEKIPNFG